MLASLSQTRVAQLPMRDLGAISVFLLLSRTDDTATRRRCAMALCNMSDEVSMRHELVDAGVMTVRETWRGWGRSNAPPAWSLRWWWLCVVQAFVMVVVMSKRHSRTPHMRVSDRDSSVVIVRPPPLKDSV